MYYYYGNDYAEAVTNEPIKIESTRVLEQYKSVYHEVIPAYEYLVMYWDDENDNAVAVFNVIALDEQDAEETAMNNGGDQYIDWPCHVEDTEEWLSYIDDWKKAGIYKEVR